MRRVPILVGLAVAIVVAAAPSAQGAQRYAAPTGSGPECTQAKPCSVNEAVIGAKAGDEVIVTAGTYVITAPVFATAVNVQVHGDPAGPMPRIVALSAVGTAVALNSVGSSLSYLEVENDSNVGFGVVCGGSKLDRVRVKTVSASSVGVLALQDCSIRNSLVHVEGAGSNAIRAFPSGITKSSMAVRNVTALALGSGSAGVVAEYNEAAPGEFALELQNSIVQGGEADLKAVAGPKGPGNIIATHSNFDKAVPVGAAQVIDAGGNQTAPPLFVNAEAGDYREAAGSPTIDAGSSGELGPLDLAGAARIQGAAPDIGAFEFTPPTIGLIELLSLSPKRFRAAKSGEAILSSSATQTKAKKAPVGTTVSYSLSESATVAFTLERALPGRRVGKSCKAPAKANRGHKKCTRFKHVKGGFSVAGAKGSNSFKFSGRVGGKALVPGRYRLVGSVNGSVKQTGFTIVK